MLVAVGSGPLASGLVCAWTNPVSSKQANPNADVVFEIFMKAPNAN
jgi:hypothetical protein